MDDTDLTATPAPRCSLCYLCDKELDDSETLDHVPPKLFFPKQVRRETNPNLLTVRAHRACNEAYRLDEEYLVASLLPIVATTPAGRVLMEERASQYHRKKTQPLMRQVLSEFETRPSGLVLPDGLVVKRFDAPRIDRVLWKIVRGLFFAHRGSVLPEATPRHVVVVRGEDELPSIAGVLEGMENRGVVPEVFDYRFAEILDVDGMHLWALRLWGYFTIFVGHHAPNHDGEQPGPQSHSE